MLKVVMEGSKITIQSSTANECVEVLRYILPSYLGEEIKNIDLDKVNKDLNSGRNQVVIPLTEKELDNKEEAKRRLVFFKCTNCGTVACCMINVGDTSSVQCFNCGTDVEIDTLYRGMYHCNCGTSGNFLMQNTVSEVKCRGCKKPVILNWSEDEGAYINI